jgi:hypothetical protein
LKSIRTLDFKTTPSLANIYLLIIQASKTIWADAVVIL